MPANIKLWPDKSVASGSIVSMSLIYGIKWPGSLFGADGVSGLANIEITPEFALKLGQALGSILRPGQVVMTSRDAHPASRLTNRCIISGLLAVGVDVRDLRETPVPVSRYAVRMSGDAGVHTAISPHYPDQLLLEFFDSHGVTVDKNTERKIENIFFREDFRRTPMESVGHLNFPERVVEGVQQRIFRGARADGDLVGEHAGGYRLRARKRVADSAADSEQLRRGDDCAQRVFR